MEVLRSNFLRLFSRALFVFALLAAAPVAAAEPRPSGSIELQVKAAFLLNFAAFVEWPVNAFPDPSAPIVVGVLGDDPFGKVLDETFSGETLNGRPFEVRRLARGSSPAGMHILYVSDSERSRWQNLLPTLQNSPMLTVGNGPNFNRAGGIIEFVAERGRIRFRINQRAATAAQLTLSSKLLRLGQTTPGAE